MDQKKVNKIVSAAMQKWQLENCPDIVSIEKTGTGGTFVKTSLFASIQKDKEILGWLVASDLNPWKRGTSEARKCAMAIQHSLTPDMLKPTVVAGKSMWD